MTISRIRRAISGVILLLLCPAAIGSQDAHPLSVRDIAGTFYVDMVAGHMRDASGAIVETLYLESLEELSKVDDRWLRQAMSRTFDYRQTFVLGDSYFIFGPFRVETEFEVVEIEDEGFIPLRVRPYGTGTSRYFGVFTERPRLFDSVIVSTKTGFVIEVFDIDTLVINVETLAWGLYRRAK